MKVETFQFNPIQTQCYVVSDTDSRSCLVIDPGMSCDTEWERLNRYLRINVLTPEAVLLTHNHSDHTMGVGYLTREYPGLPVYGSVDDQNHLPPIEIQNRFFGLHAEVHYAPITHNLMDGDRLCFPLNSVASAASHELRVIDCPGHSHHGLCFYFPDDKLLFSGDVLFYCSVGRSDFGPAMGGNGPLLVRNIVQKLLTLPADVRVFPGHGPTTTIGTEATYNPYLY